MWILPGAVVHCGQRPQHFTNFCNKAIWSVTSCTASELIRRNISVKQLLNNDITLPLTQKLAVGTYSNDNNLINFVRAFISNQHFSRHTRNIRNYDQPPLTTPTQISTEMNEWITLNGTVVPPCSFSVPMPNKLPKCISTAPGCPS